ncbi:MAG: zinc ribbon domain-containing protein [Acidobacteria bacterium]|nr:zinc ribbon domain-containing protein [Acidobacteriota bacterium]
MPIYEYSCQKCGAHMEVMQKISDKPLVRHAKCGGKLTKEWSRTGFQFKGTGWYVTDYAGKKSESKDGGEAKESKESKADSKADSSAETKSASAEPKGETKTKGGKKSAGAPTRGGD